MYNLIDPILHAPLRLNIMSLLMALEDAEFTFLKEKTGATAGNLSLQLNQLQEANYIKIKKGFKGNYPVTTIKITAKGSKAFADYVVVLKNMLNNHEPIK